MGTTQRELDIILWGATGFTGQLALSCIAGKQEDFYSCKLPNQGVARANLNYGIAGRNRTKLEKVKKECNCENSIPIFIADADDEDAIYNFVSKTKVVVSCSGPFAKYSDKVVAACAELGTHYVDITGEIQWVRSIIDRFEDRAKASGAVICNMCGFDSIPFDLLTLYGVNRTKEKSKFRFGVRRVLAYLTMKGFGFSGGSLATGILQNKEPVQLTRGVDPKDPFLLGGIIKGGIREEDRDEHYYNVGSSLGGLFTSPSTMQPVNSRIVRRSAAALAYGSQFSYVEFNINPTKKSAEKAVYNARSPAPPEVIERMISMGKLPKPGHGPTPEQRKQSKFAVIMRFEADDGSILDAKCSGGEAGYEETARMVIEAGIQLAHHPHLCPGIKTGGVLTPACALGEGLIESLNSIGIKFEVVDAVQAEKSFFAKL